MAEQKEGSESPSFTITYFGIGGRAAPLRAAAFISGLSYRDRFLSGNDIHFLASQDFTVVSSIVEPHIESQENSMACKKLKANEDGRESLS